MAKKKAEINPETGKRLYELLKIAKITQAELADKLFCSQQTISKIIRGKEGLSLDMARAISENIVLPYESGDRVTVSAAGVFQSGSVHVRPQWLLGLDNYMTEAEIAVNGFSEAETIRNGLFSMLSASAEKYNLKTVNRGTYFSLLNADTNEEMKQIPQEAFTQYCSQMMKYAEFLLFEQLTTK